MPIKYKEINVALAREMFVYEPGTGLLKRKIDRPGSPAGTVVGCRFETGHLNVSFDGRMTGVHRIIWAIHYGESPSKQIDHINGNGADNRLCNLRLADEFENARNSRISSRSKSGVKGVFRIKWHRHGKRHKWRASVGHMKEYHTETFECFGQAIKYVRQKRAQLHGQFANNGYKPVGAP